MTLFDTGMLIKVLDADLVLSSVVVVTLFALAIAGYKSDITERVRRFLQADVLIFFGIALLAGNLTFSFYSHEADPLNSIAHPTIRLMYEILLIAGFDWHIANVVLEEVSWGRKMLAIVGANAVFVASLAILEVVGWTWAS
jgi:hypothetical protein